MSEDMGTTIEYAQLITILTGMSLVLFFWHLWRTIDMYAKHHDDRAAVTLVKAVGLVVVSGGMFISSLGFFIDDPQFAVAGLSISRGAMIIIAVTLIVADVRRRDNV